MAQQSAPSETNLQMASLRDIRSFLPINGLMAENFTGGTDKPVELRSIVERNERLNP